MNNWQELSRKQLLKDARIGQFIRAHGPIRFRREHSLDAFQSLAEAIIYQQISGSAAASILRKFKALWPQRSFPMPSDILNAKEASLRKAGISPQKLTYLKDLGLKFKDGTINPKKFTSMSDAEIIEHVTAVKGIGEWTAQMFLMFTLGRPDVLPTGDLGIQKAFQKIFKLRTKPSPEKMERLARAWAGHRTVACFYLWRMLDTKN